MGFNSLVFFFSPFGCHHHHLHRVVHFKWVIFLLFRGKGWRLKFIFLLHLTCAKRRGRGVSFFFVELFFHS